MRAITIMATVAGVLAAALAFAPRANADRVCRQVCEAGICQSICVDEKDRVFLDNSGDKDIYIPHDQPNAPHDQPDASPGRSPSSGRY
jgi:hypothetical protein